MEMYSLHEGEDIKKRGFAPLKFPLKNELGYPSRGKIRTFMAI